jgi:hypothetical protein
MSRKYVFTYWTNKDYINFNPVYVKYLIAQPELCPTTLKQHYQGYVEFYGTHRMKRAAEILGSKKSKKEDKCGIWFNPNVKGTKEENIIYCTKERTRKPGGVIIEYGNRNAKQGYRSDLHEITDKIVSGEKLNDLALDFPMQWVKYHRGFESLRQEVMVNESKEFRHVTVNILVGDTGTGKTRQVLYNEDGTRKDDIYVLDKGNSDRVWWDGYDGQKTILIDEFYGWLKYSDLLRILDGHQLKLEKKGGHTYACWNTVYITSNQDPGMWYRQGMTPALERRITNTKWLYSDS